MPSGDTIQGKVIAKSAEADFATQRDVNSTKRDIKTDPAEAADRQSRREVCARHDGRGLHSQEQAGEAMSARRTQTEAPRRLRHACRGHRGREHRQALWRLRSGQGRELQRCRGRDLRPAGTERRGQKHADPHDDHADSGHQRQGHCGRTRCGATTQTTCAAASA